MVVPGFAIMAQNPIITTLPPHPTSYDYIEIWYDASEGNGELAGYTGDVYMHTGLITAESQNGNDWKYVVGNWGQADTNVLMLSLGNDIYYKSFHIPSFYGFDPDQEIVLMLAFVFRNADGSIVGRSIDNSDIFYSINHTPLTDYQSHTLTDNRLCIFTGEGEIELIPYTNNAIRLSFAPTGVPFPDTSYSTIATPETVSVSLEETNDSLVLHYNSNYVVIQKNPVRFSFWNKNEMILSDEMGFYTQYFVQGVRTILEPGEILFGGGSRAIPQNRYGHLLENYNQAQYGYGYGASTLNICIPVLVSSKKYLLFYDNHWPSLISAGNFGNEIDFKTEGGRMSYFVITGNNYDELLGNYTHLTGKQPLPPRWSMGYIQSRYGYENETHARNVVDQMRAEGFPMDALVLDLYWFGDPSYMGNLTWDYSRFPDPLDMMSDFNNIGVKTILITEPFFTTNSNNFTPLDNLGYLAKTITGNSYIINDFWAGPAGLIDLTIPEANNWMWNFYQDRIEEGVAAWWSDLGEPEKHPNDMMHEAGTARDFHNIYSMLWSQMLYENYVEEYPETRLFNLARSGFAGMQRYATFPWSGDVQRSWGGLQAQIPIMLGMSMSGVGYMSSDLGGFVGGDNHELFTRWLQMGAFTPIMRPHGSNVTTEPIYFPEPYKSILKEYIELRYRFLPYNYTLAWENSVTGRPLALPMNYFEPDNAILGDIDDQYFWGENIMAAPIMQQGQTARTVYFPDGGWIDYRTMHEYVGENSYEIEAPLEYMPVFIKTGSFIPFATPLPTTKNYNYDTIGFQFYPDVSAGISNYMLYLDDGKTPDSYQQNLYELINLDGSSENDIVTLNLEKEGPGYIGSVYNHEILLEIMRCGKNPTLVTRNWSVIEIVDSYDAFLSLSEAAYFDEERSKLLVHFPWDGEFNRIEVTGAAVAINTQNNIEVSGVPMALHNPVPNPFDQQTDISFHIYNPGNYYIDIMNMAGQMVFSKAFTNFETGKHIVTWDAVQNNAGIYFIRLSDDQANSVTKKVVKY